MIARAVLLLSSVVLASGCGSSTSPRRAEETGGLVASNALRPDYAGSEACADCHHDIYEKWAGSPMRNMTRDAATAQITAPFDGATLTTGTDTATMTMAGATRYMTIARPAGEERFRITKVVGGHYREDFIGVDATHGGVERVLPATYVFATQSWRYKGYSVMVKERPGMSSSGEWRRECIPCHNTLPAVTLQYDELGGESIPAYQGKLQDRVVPERVKWRSVARDEDVLAHALADEIRFLGATPPETSAIRQLLPAAARATEAQLDGTKLVEIGVGCEACHNGSREHATTPTRLPTFEVRGAAFGLIPPAGQRGTRAQWINHTCSRCHTVLFSRYPWTWEGGARNGKKAQPGGSTTNSGEGRDYKLGGCATEMACTTCHDPHAVDPPAKLAALATTAGNAVCAGCHQAIAANPEAHSHHGPTSAGNSCVGCHLPKKNMGLDYELVRYHRIGSPNDPERTAGDRPLECALCHADKTVESLATTMARWWGKPIDRPALHQLYGPNLAVNAMRATLQFGKPHEQAVALATFGDTRDRSLAPLVAPYLAHEYPLVRYYALRALEKLTGGKVAIDVGRPAAEVRAAIAAWLAANP